MHLENKMTSYTAAKLCHSSPFLSCIFCYVPFNVESWDDAASCDWGLSDLSQESIALLNKLIYLFASRGGMCKLETVVSLLFEQFWIELFCWNRICWHNLHLKNKMTGYTFESCVILFPDIELIRDLKLIIGQPA